MSSGRCANRPSVLGRSVFEVENPEDWRGPLGLAGPWGRSRAAAHDADRSRAGSVALRRWSIAALRSGYRALLGKIGERANNSRLYVGLCPVADFPFFASHAPLPRTERKLVVTHRRPAFWPVSEVAAHFAQVRSLGHCGLDLLRLSSSSVDPLPTSD